MSDSQWLLEAYEMGKKGNMMGMTDKMIGRVLLDPVLDEVWKWWRRGVTDGGRRRRYLKKLAARQEAKLPS